MSADGPLGAEELATATGAGVRVLVVDSGAERTHPALAGVEIRCWAPVTSGGGRYRMVPDAAGDAYGHGTAVLSILRDWAPGAALESVRVLGGDLRGSSERVLAAIHWGLDQRFDVINCSFGTADFKYLEGYKRAVDRAFCEGALLVSACDNFDSRRVELPGWFPTVVSTDHGVLEGLAIRRRRGAMVEFVARGRDLRLPWKGGEYRTVTGSSFAAPHLAAVVARVRERRPTWNACEVKAALYRLAAAEPAAESAAEPAARSAAESAA